jgi:hypothetical protein
VRERARGAECDAVRHPAQIGAHGLYVDLPLNRHVNSERAGLVIRRAGTICPLGTEARFERLRPLGRVRAAQRLPVETRFLLRYLEHRSSAGKLANARLRELDTERCDHRPFGQAREERRQVTLACLASRTGIFDRDWGTWRAATTNDECHTEKD